ncbi:hypothetical protein D0B54_18650 [Solimonas sp. K1W22B-7]|uniref:glycosyl hydrolase n=1 Tax=Solimonas sp. K1W22B-7 TaxID=2303331 RepID=UPI000E3376C4|nr:glycosyl hydrolase [Solimonas sp. K1W22B-7]AXQ30578.1 hypothetical protein D0B54_18650 [Solimonas sp. K1W22B-7]
MSLRLLLPCCLALLLAACGSRSTPVDDAGAGTPAAVTGGRSAPTPLLTAASFADPPVQLRPRYRWYQPMALTDDEELRRELRAMRQVGAGGAEVAAFPATENLADQQTSPNSQGPFLQEFGWGTPRWAHKIEVMLEEAHAQGIGLDMTIGPYWPSVLPTIQDINDPRVQQQLLYGAKVVAAGARFSGVPPPPKAAPPAGAQTQLVALLAARCLNALTCQLSATLSDLNATAESNPVVIDSQLVPAMLDPDSVVDLSASLVDGRLQWTAPAGGGSWVLLSFWQSGEHQVLAGDPAKTTTLVLDHLSVQAAQAVADYWDQNILTPRARELINALGGASVFEDSLELSSSFKWTWTFLEDFQAHRGYSLLRYLPALTGTREQGTAAPAFDFPGGIGARVRHDYRQSWSDLYAANRLATLRRWLHGRGMTLRAQPYGDPIDIPFVASQLDIPEGESLGFGDLLLSGNPQWYKLIAAGAHLSGGSVVSQECCAFLGPAYATTATQNLQEIYRGYAGGVTLQIWSGFPYAALSTSTWPGWDGFGFPFTFAENWGPRLPAWDQYRAVNDHLARLQLALRQGKPRFDVAVYWQDYGLGLFNSGSSLQSDGHSLLGTDRIIPSGSELARRGYTYEYLSPAFFSQPGAVWESGRLFPSTSAYKAVVIRRESRMPLEAAQKLLQLARQGMPVVMVGDAPTQTPGWYGAGAEDASVREAMQQLLDLPGVRRVNRDDDIPDALLALGVRPSIEYDGASKLLSLRRQTDDTDYYYLFNATTALQVMTEIQLSGVDADVTASLEGEGQPYELDAWSGHIRSLAEYQAGEGRVRLQLSLKKGDVRLIAISRRRLDNGSASQRPASAVGADLLYRDGALVARATQAGRQDVVLGDGRSASADIAAVPSPIALNQWRLSAESWEPGDSASQTRRVAHELTVNALPGGKLPGWLLLPGLTIASGTGRYSTSVNLGPAWSGGHGAWLDLGEVLDTAAVTVNGKVLPPINLLDPGRIDLGPYLQAGENHIVVDIATTLGNRVRVARLTQPSISMGLFGGALPQNYGLLGPVRLIPYGEAVVKTGDEAG